MKFFFFLFGAIKFVLAEEGSAYGYGRVCVKEEWVHLNHTSHLGLKLMETVPSTLEADNELT